MAYGLTKSLDLESSSSQYASRADEAAISITGNLSIEAWVNFESLPANNTLVSIVAKYLETSSNRSYAFFFQNLGGVYKLGVRISSTGANDVVKTVDWTPSTATWYHVAVVYTAAGGTADFYVGGVQQGAQQTSLPNSIADTTTALIVGADSGFGSGVADFFDGKISLVRLWNTARSSAQISANICNVFGTAETGMVGEWSLNDVYTDASGNGLTLTASGSPVFATDVPSSCSVVGPANLKSYNTNLKANIKSMNTNLIANVKTFDTNA